MSENKAVITAINTLTRLGILNTPQYWKEHYAETKYVDALILKAASFIKVYGARCSTVQDGIDALVNAGIIDTPAYWQDKTGNIAELLKALGGAAKLSHALREEELRKKPCDAIQKWLGGGPGGSAHKDILRIYNSYEPLARGYKMTEKDPYCATTVSAAFITAGIAKHTGTECSCTRFMELAKKKGIWVENDAYAPRLGDAVVYDWNDSGVGDNTGEPDHIGLVIETNAKPGYFTVAEGNMSGGKIGTRELKINGRYIRGFICPDYKTLAKYTTL